MSNLTHIRDAQAAVETAKAGVVAAIREARANGVSVVAIAHELGVTRQRVYQLLETPKPADAEKAAMLDRLAELDKRWNRMILKLVPAFVRPDQKRETGYRNAQTKKRANKGLAPLRTVKAEARVFAEEYVLQYLEDHSGIPVCQVALAEVREADELRMKLTALSDDALSF